MLIVTLASLDKIQQVCNNKNRMKKIAVTLEFTNQEWKQFRESSKLNMKLPNKVMILFIKQLKKFKK